MKNCLIGCIALLTMSGIAFGEGKDPPKELAVDLGGSVKLEMVLIPAGSFMMGDDTERPVHKVNITKPFYLGKYEVTQEQWQAVVGTTPSHFKGAKLPVEEVSWGGCQYFLDKLNEKIGGRGGKFVLPTEAQWEYACRAGSNKEYCFGDDESPLGEYGWFAGNSGNTTHPVGEKKPNAWGLYDMHGNVCEWCQDWYAEYGAKLEADPSGPTTGSPRTNRGGGWDYHAGGCHSAYRNHAANNYVQPFLGFRVARVPADK